MPRAEPGTAPPTRRVQHATTCYVFRFRQKFGEPGFWRKLILNNNLRLFLPWLSWEAPVGLTLCRYESYVDMIHVVDFEKTALSTSFRGVLAPSGPQISAESGRATRSLAPGKPGWPPMTTWPLFSRPTPHAPHPTPLSILGGRRIGSTCKFPIFSGFLSMRIAAIHPPSPTLGKNLPKPPILSKKNA